MLRKDVLKGSGGGKALPAATPTPAISPPATSPTTADPAEIARFNALAGEWWKPDGAFKVVHAFNRARVAHLSVRLPALLARSASHPLPLAGLRMIDVGCGAGLVTEPMAALGAGVLGIDASERNVRVAAHHAQETGATVLYRHALPETIVTEGQTFDIVLSLEVVEHVADLPAFMTALGRLVAPGGLLVIGTLNRTPLSFVKAIVGAEYILRWLPRGTHDWRKFVRPQELAAHLAPLGFKVEERCGVALNPLTMQWHITTRLDATYLQFHRKSG